MSIISSRKKGSRFYWAELGFIALGFLGLNPSLVTDILFGTTATIVQQSLPAAYSTYQNYNANNHATNPYLASYDPNYGANYGAMAQHPQSTPYTTNDVANRLGSFVSNAANHLQDYWSTPVGVGNVPSDQRPSTSRNAAGYPTPYSPVANNAYGYGTNTNTNYYPTPNPNTTGYGYTQPTPQSNYYPANPATYPPQYTQSNNSLGANYTNYPAVAQNGFGNTVPPAGYSSQYANSNSPYGATPYNAGAAPYNAGAAPYTAQLPGAASSYGSSYPGHYSTANQQNPVAWNNGYPAYPAAQNSNYVPAGSTASALGLAPMPTQPTTGVNARNYLATPPSTNWQPYPATTTGGVGRY